MSENEESGFKPEQLSTFQTFISGLCELSVGTTLLVEHAQTATEVTHRHPISEIDCEQMSELFR